MESIGREALRAPARVAEIELSSLRTAAELDVEGYETLWCLTRNHGLPLAISFWDVRGDRTVAPNAVADQLPAIRVIDTDGDDDPYALARISAQVNADEDVAITVAICTHERPDDLRRALTSLAEQHDKNFRTLVVDNAPRSRATAGVVEEVRLSDCDYLIEPQKGLSRARNTALAHITSDHVAWFDDDEMADPDWISRLKQGFRHASRPAAVCGLMLPAELETRAQILFEQYGGFNKGRGLSPDVHTEILHR